MKKLFLMLTQPVLQLNIGSQLLIAVPRIFCGYLMAFEFGAAKFGMPWSEPDKNLGLFEVAFWFPADVARLGGIFATFPVFFAWMGAFSEAVGGLCLMLGLQTRISSFLILCTMLDAAFCQQRNEGFWNMLPSLCMGAICIYTLVLGSGKFGLDYFITKNITTNEN